MGTRIKTLTDQLPPTPVTPKMREDIVAIASNEGRSIAEIQREAFSLFLRKRVSSTRKKLSISEGRHS